MKRFAQTVLKTGMYAIYAYALLPGCKLWPADQVSYARQIAPVFAMHCTGCHSDENPSSDFRTGSYSGLMQGGTIGNDVVPGKPDASILVQLIEGVRGLEQQMPSGARPLSASQIQMIRNWIDQGAKYDRVSTPCYSLLSRSVFPEYTPLQISFRIPDAGVVELLLREPSAQKIIFRREASIKPAPEAMDAGSPEHWITWAIGRERGWPAEVDVELRIRYTARAPTGALLRIGVEGKSAALVGNLKASSCEAR